MSKESQSGTLVVAALLFVVAILFSGLEDVRAEVKPDLAIGQIKVESAAASPGKCTIKVEIRNVGTRGLSKEELQRGNVFFNLNGSQNGYRLDYVNTKFHGSLDKAGGKVWVTPPAGQGEITPGKSWNFTADVDSSHLIDESNENNNLKTVTLTCDALPDLAVTRVYKKPSPQGGCEIWAEVKNVGKYEMPKEMFNGSSIRFYVGTRENGYLLNYLTGSRSLLLPGGSLQVKAPAGVDSFSGMAKVRVELFIPPTSDRTVWDANSSNNEKEATLSCINIPTQKPKDKFKPHPPLHKIPMQPR